MDPLKIYLLGSVVVIFVILLWFAFVFPRLWLWTYFRTTGERLPRGELVSRLWKVSLDEIRRLAEEQNEDVRNQILNRMRMDQVIRLIYGLVVLWFAGAVSLLVWLVQ